MSEFGYTGNISSGAGTFDNFKSNNVVNGTKEFLESNSLVAKIAFLLLVLIVFVIAVKFSSQLLAWLFSYNKSPYLVDGMINSKKQMVIIPQDPNENGSIPIIRSDNQDQGVELLILRGYLLTTWFIKRVNIDIFSTKAMIISIIPINQLA